MYLNGHKTVCAIIYGIFWLCIGIWIHKIWLYLFDGSGIQS